MTKLSVNLNKVALLRNSRHLGIPSVTKAARTCVAAGAHGITVHPRPDERHIRRSDVYELADVLRESPQIEYNIEGYPDERFLTIVEQLRPTQATLVPDSPEQFTSDHGWNVAAEGARLRPLIARLKSRGIRVALFMDADPAAMALAAAVGADRVELYTEPYAAAFGTPRGDEVFDRYAVAARRARDAGLELNAGHDLNLENLGRFVGGIPGILEVSIGHALTSDALDMGLAAAVRAYLEVLRGAAA